MKTTDKFLYIILTILVSILMSVLNYSCVDDIKIIDGDSYSIIKGDKVEVHLKVNLDNSGNERIRTREINRENDGIHNPDYSNPGIGHGTLATTLIYQLYDENGSPVALPNPDSNSDIIGLHQVRVENRKFPYSDIVFTINNGKEYTMIFWAQSGEDGNLNTAEGDENDSETEEDNDTKKEHNTKGDWFYDTEDLKNIIVRYDSQNNEGQGQLNNTDSRDAFCAKVKFIGGQPLPEVTLRRVLAQVNIGFTPELSEKLKRSNVDIQKSSIWIANVGRRFNLFKNQVELFNSDNTSESQENDIESLEGGAETGKGGITWPFTMGAYNINTIPAYMEYPGKDVTGENKLKIGNDEFEWISMCYILAPGETDEEWTDGISVAHDHGSTVDIVNMQFYDINGNAYTLPLTSMTNVPVKRNYRTNIIVDKLFNATISMDAEIGTDAYDDFGVNSDGIYDGELTDGLTYRYSDTPSHWNMTPGLNFYVSSLQGLKWLADRSNGLDFKLKDIPKWMEKNEGWQELSDQDKLMAYEEKVWDILFGVNGENRALLYKGRGREYAKRNKWGYRMPVTFGDCTIYLTNDLDFNDDPELMAEWHGFSCNMSYYNGGTGKFMNEYGEWFMTSDRNLGYAEVSPSDENFYYSNSHTNNPHGFRGIFDGQGYTIYNMIINNLDDFYEKNDFTGNRQYGPRKLNNAAFICTATDYAEIKDLRLYNAYITGDFNMGGFIGYMGNCDANPSPLKITNCRFVNSRIEGAEPFRYSPSDDANVGAIAGSVAYRCEITDCQVINSDIISTFIGAAFIGIPPGNGGSYFGNKVYDTNVILTELNNVGTINGSVDRSAWEIKGIHDASFFFGFNRDFDASGFNVNHNGNSSINAFYGIKYKPGGNNTSGSQSANISAYGKSSISDVPLELFPEILTSYAQSIKLDSHITGEARSDGNISYGLKIDISGQPKSNSGNGGGTLISNDNKGNIDFYGNKPEWYFTLEGSTYNSLPLEGLADIDEKYRRQHVLLVSSNGKNDVKGIYVCAPDIPRDAIRHVTIKDIIIAGEPSIEYGLFLDNVKEMTLDHVAIYDVKNAFGDINIPQGASFRTKECDFRGVTNIGLGYNKVLFENTVFNKGSGNTENVIGRLYAKSSATFKGCMFRVDYKIVVGNKDAVLTFDDCMCGPPYNEVKLTKEIFWKYMESTASQPFLGKVKFSGDDKLYSYEDLIKFKPQ